MNNMDASSKAEVWKPIAGYEGLYDVSSHGRIRSHHTRGRQSRTTTTDNGIVARIVKPVANNYGYLKVTLRRAQTSTQYLVSHLVLAAFSTTHKVFYLDGDRTNLAATNLRYGTAGINS